MATSVPEGRHAVTAISGTRTATKSFLMLLVLLEIVLLPEGGLDGVFLVSEIGLEAGAEVDVPAPDAAEHRFRILVVVRSELAVLAGVLCHIRMFLSPDGTKVMLSYRITYDCPWETGLFERSTCMYKIMYLYLYKIV